MQTTFTHSLSVLQQGSKSKVVMWLLLTIVLILLWLAWFVFANIPIYQISTYAVLSTSSRLDAYFSPRFC